MKWTLTEEERLAGRALLEKAFQDLNEEDGGEEALHQFYDWMDDNIAIDMSIAFEVFQKCHRAQDGVRAVKLFNAVVPQGYDPIKANIAWLLTKNRVVQVGLGVVLLGVYYLIAR